MLLNGARERWSKRPLGDNSGDTAARVAGGIDIGPGLRVYTGQPSVGVLSSTDARRVLVRLSFLLFVRGALPESIQEGSSGDRLERLLSVGTKSLDAHVFIVQNVFREPEVTCRAIS